MMGSWTIGEVGRITCRVVCSGEWSRKPLIEMTIPSAVDRGIVPDDPNAHVVLLFTQYTPYSLKWDEQMKDNYAKHGTAALPYAIL